jgi:predicted dehydrogenase/threonine dehydrogenase-like Zn-dependent dehydrogenase
MKQVVQEVGSGVTAVRHLPDPVPGPGQLSVGILASVVSVGTERYLVNLARKSLLGKARQRPDQVKRVLQKVRAEGLASTLQQIGAKLDEPMPLGYSSAGIVLECGRGVSAFKPGDRVATAGPHAGIVVVGQNLCARIPDSLSFEQAAYASIGAIGLEGIRLARVTLGESVLVIGLGLIGQLSVAMLKAQGCRVFGTDPDPARRECARLFGADAVGEGSPVESVRGFAGGWGVDAVVITAATPSNDPIEFAAAACRVRGRIVLVGVVGLTLPRPPFFEKELEFTVSSSLGPGRSDPSYEERGLDYPIGHARWTAQRNMQAVLDLMAAGKLPAEKLTSQRFPIEQAEKAYDLITSGREPFTGVVLEYADAERAPVQRVNLSIRAAPPGDLGISVVGAGNFSRLILLPALERVRGLSFRGICTGKGMSAEHTGRAKGFAFATTDVEEVWEDEATKAVFILTRHDLHAQMVLAALRAGKNVFVEKPLCIRHEELEEIRAELAVHRGGAPLLMVGFNRRFAPAMACIRKTFIGVEPLAITYRFAPGPIPHDHWTQDEEVGGGRIVGEACHAIDACTAIADSEPMRVYAESVAKTGGLLTTDDRVLITLRHRNGSISSVSYQAGGDRSGPTERIEVFGGGRTLTLEGWNTLDVWSGGRHIKASGRKDKGHRAEVVAFLEACRCGGAWPIPWSHLFAIAWASMAAVDSLREGFPQEQTICAE